MLRHVARRTWRYFTEFVGPESAWLPPDNYQAAYGNGLAMRTSPTNIGLWLLSALGAHDFGYLTGDEVIERGAGSLGPSHGWNGITVTYSTGTTCRPSLPSSPGTCQRLTVATCLLACGPWMGGMRDAVDKPLLQLPQAFRGIRDTFGCCSPRSGRQTV